MSSIPGNPVDPAITAAIAALPVTARRDDIIAAIRGHRVVIVSGETGSGKTTQLPKLCLAAGRGALDPRSGRHRLIGHTQPRRLAATSVAERIAEELGSPLGTDVGYQIRFNERLAPTARIKLMTDGILLAETQRDRLLSRYDTLIVDEAHERSLNIDFLLGYLRQLVFGPRRDDLKLIITSATIDAERFARHFGEPDAPAPVIEVSGRLYPVEIRYRPLDGSGDPPPAAAAGRAGDAPGGDVDAEDETDLPSAIEAAIVELWSVAPGDVLVFLPGEREIRDVAEHLRRTAARSGRRGAARRLVDADIVPLFARLPAADQQRVFHPGPGLRIVLATNVAETSLTVPRIRYVVDSGLARIKRYRIRGKVDQLLIEPVSQAAANQRAGRCGRVSDGICIRLYGETDFQGRPRFTDPEILRSSLAAVILRMNALGLTDVAAFPFLDPPSPKAIADGYALLHELGAMTGQRELTAIGRQLARLPVDPRIARMLLAGHRSGCLTDVLVIAAGLSVQDPRERPPAASQAADQAHARFQDPRSDFLGWLKLWHYWQAQVDGRKARGESHRALAARLGREFLSVRRLREWADVHGQLTDLAREMRWSIDGAPAALASQAGADALHRALLTGLLGNVGTRLVDDPGYQGTHQQKFWLHPGSAVGRRSVRGDAGGAGSGGGAGGAEAAATAAARAARWVMAAEMVDTGRLQARMVAAVRPEWIEAAAGPLVSRSWSDPYWSQKSGQAMAQERGALYGLTLYSQRRVPFGTIDPVASRRLMIREGLVAGEWPGDAPFIRHNRAVIADIERLEHKIRRPDLLIDETALADWFDARVPPEIHTAQALEHWYRDARRQDPALLQLSRDALLKKDAEGVDDRRFPKSVTMRGVDFLLEYHFEPGAGDDGVTMTVPLFALNQVDADRCDWLVPGMLQTKVELLLKSLPQRYRRHLLPLAGTAAGFVAATVGTAVGAAVGTTVGAAEPEAPPPRQPLLDALIDHLRRTTGISLRPDDFRLEAIPVHLLMNFRVIDEHGRFLAMSRQLSRLRAELGGQAQSSFQQAFARIAGQVARRGSPAAGGDAGGAADRASASASSGVGTGAGVIATAATPAGSARGARPEPPSGAEAAAAGSTAGPAAEARYTGWTFGELPELLELPGPEGTTLVGFPALIDAGDAVRIEVFDEPEVAARRHRDGVVRLFALGMADAVKAFERDLRRNASLELMFSTLPVDQSAAGSLASQVIAAAIDRSCLADGLPTDADGFATRLAQGRSRFLLTAQEIVRLTQTVLTEYGAVRRKLALTRQHPEAVADIEAQLAGLFGAGFVRTTPFENLAHYPRYLKAIVLRLDKLREQPERDRALLAEMAPLVQRWQRRRKALKGAVDAEVEHLRWLLEELRVSLFAQSLRTPMPVSVKRLTRILDQQDARH